MAAIGQAARDSGVGIETIRFYERKGLVRAPARDAGNRRDYTPDDIGRLRFLKRCRDLGFSLADAKALLDLSDEAAPDCAGAQALARRHAQAVRAKIADLQRLDHALADLIATCADGRADCQMLRRLRRG